ncbi:hypothetical protein [Cellvibrio sp. UBA7671]|uniref:hypothetical protein n=1 Tax=Cellvibrio sp. UBA7671 TaxID=1946312 RepID=UPI002F35BA9F
MNAQGILNQYWHLILVMLLPARYVKWLGVFTLAVLIPGAILNFFGYSIVLHLGSAFSLLLIMMVGMLVPGQMLALRSSKQFQYMADLRYPLFFIALGFWSLESFWLSITLTLLNPKEFSFYSIFALTTMALTCAAVLFAVVGSYIQTAQGFVPLFVWILFLSAKNTDLLSVANIGIYWLVTALLWLGMFVWWVRWQPQKYLINFMTLPAAEMQRQQANNVQAITNVFSAVPKTLAGSLLAGVSDGIQAWCKRELGQLVFFLLLLMFMLYWARQIPANAASMMVSIYVFIYICIRGGIIFQSFFRNLYRLWINSSYSRLEILTYIERRYFFMLVSSIVPVALVFVLINHYLLNDLLGLIKGAYVLFIGFLFSSLAFYVGLLVYIKSAASFVLLNWIIPIVNLGLIGIMVYLNILWGPNPAHEHASYLWFSGALLMLTLLGRVWVKSIWKSVNFYGVKN